MSCLFILRGRFSFSLFVRDKSLATFMSYRSAIASIHRGFPDGSTVSTSVHLSRLFRAFFLEEPPTCTLVPFWSLPAILKALAKPSFEPLAQASFYHLLIKTVFLIAVAWGHRRSSLHALTVDPGHIRWEPSGARLFPKAGFLAKNSDSFF